MGSLFTRNRAEAWRSQHYQGPAQLATFLANQPRVLPTAPPPATHLSRQLLVNVARLLLIVVLLVVLALSFFLFGEERPERVRPDPTPTQRARAFRLPNA